MHVSELLVSRWLMYQELRDNSHASQHNFGVFQQYFFSLILPTSSFF